MMTIEVECPVCETTFDVDEFDETQQTEDTTCPECGAELEISEFDPVTREYYIEDVSDSPADKSEQSDLEAFGQTKQEEEDEAEEEAGLIVTDDEEDEEEEES